MTIVLKDFGQASQLARMVQFNANHTLMHRIGLDL